MCDQFDSQGQLLGTAVYRQVVQNADQAYRLDHWQQYVARVEDRSKEIPAGLEVAVQAVYLNKQTGKTVPLNLFIGHTQGTPLGSNAPQPVPLKKSPAPPGVAENESPVVLLDLTPGAAPAHYQGDTTQRALHEFEHNNGYSEGWIELSIPSTAEVIKNKKIQPTANLPGAEKGALRIATKGHSDLAAGVDFFNGLGLGAASLAAVLTVASAGLAWVPLLFAGALGAGVIGATLDEIDNWQRGTLDPEIVAIDVLAIISSMLGGTGGESTLNVLEKWLGKSIGERIMVTEIGRWAVYTGYKTGVVDGLLIGYAGADRIQEVLSDPDMARNQKFDAISKILQNMALTGGLLAFGAWSIKQPSKRIASVVRGGDARPFPVEMVQRFRLVSDEAVEKLKAGHPTAQQLVLLDGVLEHALTLPNAEAHLARLNTLLEKHGVAVLEALEKRPGGRVPYLENYFRNKGP